MILLITPKRDNYSFRFDPNLLKKGLLFLDGQVHDTVSGTVPALPASFPSLPYSKLNRSRPSFFFQRSSFPALIPRVISSRMYTNKPSFCQEPLAFFSFLPPPPPFSRDAKNTLSKSRVSVKALLRIFSIRNLFRCEMHYTERAPILSTRYARINSFFCGAEKQENSLKMIEGPTPPQRRTRPARRAKKCPYNRRTTTNYGRCK